MLFEVHSPSKTSSDRQPESIGLVPVTFSHALPADKVVDDAKFTHTPNDQRWMPVDNRNQTEVNIAALVALDKRQQIHDIAGNAVTHLPITLADGTRAYFPIVDIRQDLRQAANFELAKRVTAQALMQLTVRGDVTCTLRGDGSRVLTCPFELDGEGNYQVIVTLDRDGLATDFDIRGQDGIVFTMHGPARRNNRMRVDLTAWSPTGTHAKFEAEARDRYVQSLREAGIDPTAVSWEENVQHLVPFMDRHKDIREGALTRMTRAQYPDAELVRSGQGSQLWLSKALQVEALLLKRGSSFAHLRSPAATRQQAFWNVRADLNSSILGVWRDMRKMLQFGEESCEAWQSALAGIAVKTRLFLRRVEEHVQRWGFDLREPCMKGRPSERTQEDQTRVSQVLQAFDEGLQAAVSSASEKTMTNPVKLKLAEARQTLFPGAPPADFLNVPV